MGKILNGPDGDRNPWAEATDGVWHFRPSDDWWETQADIQASGRCGAQFASCHVSTFWPGHLNHRDEPVTICPRCDELWKQQEIPRLASSIIDGLGPLYVESILEVGPPEVQDALRWLVEQTPEATA